MAVRRQRATTNETIVENDINSCIKKAKLRYKNTGEFYVYTVDVGSDYYYPEGWKTSENFIQYWKKNDNNRWECLTDKLN